MSYLALPCHALPRLALPCLASPCLGLPVFVFFGCLVYTHCRRVYRQVLGFYFYGCRGFFSSTPRRHVTPVCFRTMSSSYQGSMVFVNSKICVQSVILGCFLHEVYLFRFHLFLFQPFLPLWPGTRAIRSCASRNESQISHPPSQRYLGEKIRFSYDVLLKKMMIVLFPTIPSTLRRKHEIVEVPRISHCILSETIGNGEMTQEYKLRRWRNCLFCFFKWVPVG